MNQPHRSSFILGATHHLPKFVGARQLSASSLEYLYDRSARCKYLESCAEVQKLAQEACHADACSQCKLTRVLLKQGHAICLARK